MGGELALRLLVKNGGGRVLRGLQEKEEKVCEGSKDRKSLKSQN